MSDFRGEWRKIREKRRKIAEKLKIRFKDSMRLRGLDVNKVLDDFFKREQKKFV